MPTRPSLRARLIEVARLPMRWWERQSLRARLTLLSTALFSFAVVTGVVLVIVLQGYALTRILDSSAVKTAADIAAQFEAGKGSSNVLPTTGGILEVQVVDANNLVIAASPGADRATPILTPAQVQRARNGATFTIEAPAPSPGRWRVLGRTANGETVLVVTDYSRVDDSQRILTTAALIGGPIAVFVMACAAYAVAALTLRPVAALREGAATITAAGLSDQRLPVPSAKDEVHRLAVTLNAMLDRIDVSTARQRTFVGDAAHELRSPLASLRIQLEVAQLLGTARGEDGHLSEQELQLFLDDVMLDVGRLERLVSDLLALARLDESGGTPRRLAPVDLGELVNRVARGYERRNGVIVTADVTADVTVNGDEDGLQRVIINLLDNAVRYAQTEVNVSVSGDLLAGRPIARLTVTDDGPGLPEEERERVFDRFYRLEESRSRESGGTGLGLPIVRDIARAHGGSVRLDARPDGESGVAAIVLLPAASNA